MSVEGVDFSFARPGGAAIVAAGKSFVVRYVPYSGDGGKGLTAAEIKDYRRHGLAIALVYESIAQRALAGKSAGAADARRAQAALASLGMPLDLPIYFACDWNATSAQQPTINAYLAGAASVIGIARVGVYGGYGLITRTKAARTARWFWQTYAWSYSKIASGIHLYQWSNGHRINGGAVDYTRAMVAEYGQWPAATTPPDTSTEETPTMGLRFRITDSTPGTVTVAGDGHSLIRVYDAARTAVPAGEVREVVAKVALLDPLDAEAGDRTNGYLVGKKPSETANVEAAFLLASDVNFTPRADDTPFSADDVKKAIAEDRKRATVGVVYPDAA